MVKKKIPQTVNGKLLNNLSLTLVFYNKEKRKRKKCKECKETSKHTQKREKKNKFPK